MVYIHLKKILKPFITKALNHSYTVTRMVTESKEREHEDSAILPFLFIVGKELNKADLFSFDDR